jgi:serine/threonine protein kinase
VRRRRTTSLRSGGRVGPYVLEERIGRGGFGEVWRARHEISALVAAVKLPRDAQLLDALHREGALTGKLDHPLVVAAIEAGLDDDPPWIAFRWIDGASLRERIRRGALAVEAALDVYGDVLSALTHAHGEGVVHGDVKPENVLLDAEGRAHLTDFGLGRAVGEVAASVALSGRNETTTGVSLSGTIEYMAPEQRRGPPEAQSDLYALAIVLFEMLTGALPEGAESPSDLRPGLDPRIDELFHRGHARRERRYASAAEALRHLDRVLESRRETGRTCPGCGAESVAGEYFCDRCGTRLRADLDRCACGHLPENGDTFCIRCGKERHGGRTDRSSAG